MDEIELLAVVIPPRPADKGRWRGSEENRPQAGPL